MRTPSACGGLVLFTLFVLFAGELVQYWPWNDDVTVKTFLTVKEQKQQATSTTTTTASKKKNNDHTDDVDWRSHVRFFVLGAQKCGTSSLYEYLGQHPHVLTPLPKETRCYQANYLPSDPHCARYFATPRFVDRIRRSSSSSEYDDDYVTGDFSPGGLWKTETTVPRVVAAYPRARLVASIRHPLRRAVSQYDDMTSRGGGRRRHDRSPQYDHHHDDNNTTTTPTFEALCLEELQVMREVGMFPYWKFPDDDEASSSSLDRVEDAFYRASVNATEFATSFFGSPAMIRAWRRLLSDRRVTRSRGTVQRGLYALVLSRWKEAFSLKPLLVVTLEDMSRNVSAVMRRVHAHLGLTPVLPLRDTTPVNAARTERKTIVSPRVRVILEKVYRPYDQMLIEVLSQNDAEEEEEDFVIPWVWE